MLMRLSVCMYMCLYFVRIRFSVIETMNSELYKGAQFKLAEIYSCATNEFKSKI